MLVAPAPAVGGVGGPRRKRASAPTDVRDLSTLHMSVWKGLPFSGPMAAPLTSPPSCFPRSRPCQCLSHTPHLPSVPDLETRVPHWTVTPGTSAPGVPVSGSGRGVVGVGWRPPPGAQVLPAGQEAPCGLRATCHSPLELRATLQSLEGLFKVTQSCFWTLCNPMDCTVCGILQARLLELVAVPFSRESSQPRD